MCVENNININNGIIEGNVAEFTLNHNKIQSQVFCSSGSQLKRRLYRAKHPTEILVMKCMDGRLNLSLFAEVPPGILQPFRNIGAKFDLGWPYLQELVRDAVNFSIAKGRECLMISSYHFSKGDYHRGCAGFNYDTEAAKKSAFALEAQFNRAAGSFNVTHASAFAITIGMETDEEALIFHGTNGQELNVAELDSGITQLNLRIELEKLYPTMSPQMLNDIIPLIEGNLDHIKTVRASGKAPIDCEHREQIIVIGSGVDWLHLPNTALIVGPYSLNWPENVRVAGKIVLDSIAEKRIPKESGVLLLASALHRTEQGGFGANLKEEKVRYMLEQSLLALKDGVPELIPHLHILTGVVNADTRLLDVIDHQNKK